MASHVPFLAVRPDDQFSSEVKAPDFAHTNGILVPSTATTTAATMSSDNRPGAMVGALGSKLPNALRFPVALSMSLGANMVLFSIMGEWAGPEFAAVKRPLTEPWQVGVLVAWKVVELAGAWWAGFDYLDLASLTFLANLPYYYLLKTFFSLSLLACASALAIDVCAVSLPFALLLPLDPSHIHPSTTTRKTPIDQDKNIRLLMTVFAATVYSVVVWSSIFTWLPSYMIVHFDGIRTFTEAHELELWKLSIVMIPVGMAAMEFLFTPSVAADKAARAATTPVVKFAPETATLGETFAYNLGLGNGGFSKKSAVLAQRTAVLAVCQFANCVFRTYGTVEGTELLGAVGWSGVWAAGALAVGLSYGWTSSD